MVVDQSLSLLADARLEELAQLAECFVHLRLRKPLKDLAMSLDAGFPPGGGRRIQSSEVALKLQGTGAEDSLEALPFVVRLIRATGQGSLVRLFADTLADCNVLEGAGVVLFCEATCKSAVLELDFVAGSFHFAGAVGMGIALCRRCRRSRLLRHARPADPAAPWRLLEAPAGSVKEWYYWNEETGVTSWEAPVESEDLGDSRGRWRANVSPEGDLYYYNEVTMETSWTLPEDAILDGEEAGENAGGEEDERISAAQAELAVAEKAAAEQAAAEKAAARQAAAEKAAAEKAAAEQAAAKKAAAEQVAAESAASEEAAAEKAAAEKAAAEQAAAENAAADKAAAEKAAAEKAAAEQAAAQNAAAEEAAAEKAAAEKAAAEQAAAENAAAEEAAAEKAAAEKAASEQAAAEEAAAEKAAAKKAAAKEAAAKKATAENTKKATAKKAAAKEATAKEATAKKATAKKATAKKATAKKATTKKASTKKAAKESATTTKKAKAAKHGAAEAIGEAAKEPSQTKKPKKASKAKEAGDEVSILMEELDLTVSGLQAEVVSDTLSFLLSIMPSRAFWAEALQGDPELLKADPEELQEAWQWLEEFLWNQDWAVPYGPMALAEAVQHQPALLYQGVAGLRATTAWLEQHGLDDEAVRSFVRGPTAVPFPSQPYPWIEILQLGAERLESAAQWLEIEKGWSRDQVSSSLLAEPYILLTAATASGAPKPYRDFPQPEPRESWLDTHVQELSDA
ncbi:unnamed protein product [Effrenium voratum]|uniref:WW domain-containing protein n=1 Tax=Effrenium voratum TaxID=2562239 RepID=A0AA36N4L8_9DINO|nr:unnamed protein product [Effrenium voratum]